MKYFLLVAGALLILLAVARAGYRVQYLCFKQGNKWRGRGRYFDRGAAESWAEVMLPAQGKARVVDWFGRVVWER